MTETFEKNLEELRNRVAQVAGYQRVSARTATGYVAHFTSWETCTAMYQAAKRKRGITLWASEADCLNDPLEGKELLAFAEQTGRLIEQTRPPVWATGQYDRQPWSRLQRDDTDHEDLPHLAKEHWTSLVEALVKLYAQPVAIVPSSPRKEVLRGSGVYLVSFCREVDRLDLWRAYAGEADGVSLVMPLADAVRLVSRTGWSFFRVAYDELSKARAWALLFGPLSAAMDRACPDDFEAIRRTLGPALYLFKNEQFRTEREIRLIYGGSRALRVEAKSNVSTYVKTSDFFLRQSECRAILGPKTSKPYHRAALLHHLHTQMTASGPFTVERSAVPFV